MSTIHETTQRTAGHISQPFTLTQICEIVMTGQYNADLMLQHLLLCADSLQRENAALRADAERYRWIKEDNSGVYDVLELFMSYLNCDLDKEIDSARAKEAKP